MKKIFTLIVTLLLICSSSWAGTFTIRVKKDVASTMDLSNGLYLWWWETSQDGQLAPMTLESEGWYTTTINSAASSIKCLAVNQDVAFYGWTGCQQTADFTDITGDICLLIHADWDWQGHYLLTETSCTASGSVAYELNGGVTNDYGWLNKGDMFAAFMTDAGATEFETLEYYMAQANPLGHPNICAKLTDASPALAMEKWAWLKAYIEKAHTDQAAEGAYALPADGTGVAWRYAVGAFFISGKNGNWPVSADFSRLGLDEAYIPAWKHAYANPTEPTGEWVLNAPYYEGKTFDGWYATADFSGEKVTTINAETVGTLYAKWVDYISTIAEVSALADDTETKCSGVVNHIDGRNIYIQDATGGILVYTLEVPNCQVGDKIIVKGVKDMYGGAPEVKSAVVESAEAASVAAPTVFETLEALVADSHEHKYFASNVQILGVTIVEYDAYNCPTVQDIVGNQARCHKMVLDPTEFPIGTKINVTAVAGWYNGFQFVGNATGIEKSIAGEKDAYAYPARYDGRYQLTNTWVISNNEDNFAANRPAMNDYARGMAVKDGKMYFINRENASITVVDGATGEMLDPIIITGEHLFEVENEDGSWGASCTLPYNDIKFDDAGNCLIGSCMSGLNQTFIIYLVDLETGEATEIVKERLGANPDFEVSFASGRIDAFGVAGDVTKNGVVMAVNNYDSWDVYRWKITNGVTAPAERIVCNATGSLYQEAIGFGTASHISPQDETGSVFYVDGFNTLPMRFNDKGELLGDFINCTYGTQIVNAEGDTCKMNPRHNGLCEFQVGDEYFLVMAATNTAGSPTSSFALYKFADESRAFDGLEPLWFFPKNGMGSTTNGCRTAPVSVEVKDDVAYIYVYTNNNGYARQSTNTIFASKKMRSAIWIFPMDCISIGGKLSKLVNWRQ